MSQSQNLRLTIFILLALVLWAVSTTTFGQVSRTNLAIERITVDGCVYIAFTDQSNGSISVTPLIDFETQQPTCN